jgi:peptidoglycan hydrolase-like protein with peptidoglycan-binding domain
MHGCVWRAGSAAIAISLCTLTTGTAATGRMIQVAQNVSDPARGAAEPSPSPLADVPALPANSPEQIRKAQTELRRLECLEGRIDGKLGEQTRQAVKKFWASAKQPAVEVSITDELISDLAARGDLFCRPVRPFFGFGGGRSVTRPPFLAPGVRPIPAPAAAAPPSPAAEH